MLRVIKKRQQTMLMANISKECATLKAIAR